MTQQNLKAKFLAADDLPVKRVDFTGVHGWSSFTDLFVRVMDGHERNDYEEFTLRYAEEDGKVKVQMHRQDIWAKVAVLTACDEQGKRLFEDRDLPAVTRKSQLALKRIYDAAAELNLLHANSEGVDPNSNGGGGDASSKTSPGSGNAQPPNSLPAATVES